MAAFAGRAGGLGLQGIERRLGGAEFTSNADPSRAGSQRLRQRLVHSPGVPARCGAARSGRGQTPPAGQIRVERQTTVVARACFTGRAGKVADPLDILRPGQLVNGAKRHVLGALLPSGVPIDAGVERLGRQPAGKDVDVSGHAQSHETADSAVTQGVQLLLEVV